MGAGSSSPRQENSGHTLRYMVLITMTNFLLWQKLPLCLFFAMAAICHWPLHQLDIKNASLHGDVDEEIYMEQPGLVAQGESGLVCKLHRSLYGLKQSPRAWFGKFSYIVEAFGLKRSEVDQSVFYCHTSPGKCMYLVVFVNVIVITGNDVAKISQLK